MEINILGFHKNSDPHNEGILTLKDGFKLIDQFFVGVITYGTIYFFQFYINLGKLIEYSHHRLIYNLF